MDNRKRTLDKDAFFTSFFSFWSQLSRWRFITLGKIVMLESRTSVSYLILELQSLYIEANVQLLTKIILKTVCLNQIRGVSYFYSIV